MAQGESAGRSKTKRIREPPCVPFLWEVKPGVAKKDWKPPSTSSVALVPVEPPPVKLVASVRFGWEEEPGKPLPEFSQVQVQPGPRLLSLPPPPMSSHGYQEVGTSSLDFTAEIRPDGCDEHGLYGLDLERFGFETDDSFSSAPSLFANCLMSSSTISSAVAVDSVDYYLSENLDSSSSGDSDSDSTNSYATGASNLVEASFLERLFPHIPPETGLLGKAPRVKEVPQTPSEAKSKVLNYERNTSLVTRKAWTLGELILMSRRRSFQQKAVYQTKMHNLSMEFQKSKTFGRCLLEPSIKLIEGLQWKKIQPRLKLI